MEMSVVGVMEAMRSSLAGAVLPELQTDHARGQLAGVLDVMGKLERMMDWAPAMLQEEARPLQDVLVAVTARLAASGHPLPTEISAGEREDALALCENRVRDLCDWLFEQEGVSLPRPLRDELHAMLSAAMRQSLTGQRNRIPRADYSSMTSSSE